LQDIELARISQRVTGAILQPIMRACCSLHRDGLPRRRSVRRLPQSKESCRKIEKALLTAVNTSALISHCCSRLIIMGTLIVAATLIVSYLFFTVIFTT
jgi:hypothetical protein